MLKTKNAVAKRFDVKIIGLALTVIVIASSTLWLMLPKNISHVTEEEMKVSDGIEAKVTRPRASTETLHLSDSIERQVHYNRSALEQLSISDALAIPYFVPENATGGADGYDRVR